MRKVVTNKILNNFILKIATYVVITLVLIFPAQVFGSVIFSEVMYNLEGSDSKREWVEIFNSGADAIPLSGWKFYENDSNHGLTIIKGDESLDSGEYAVIVNDSDTFLVDWPDFSGTLFDSSFSLNNTGETLIIRDSELVDIDSVTYSSEQGGSGDGSSLYYTSSEWLAGTPTPGSGPLSATQPESQEEESNQTETPSSSGSVGNFPVEPQIFAHIGEFEGGDRIVTVGADIEFNGRAIGLTGEEIINARFMWNFGDGSRVEGKSVLYHYRYPGEYVVVLEVSSGGYSASDRVYLSAHEAQIYIDSASSDKITIHNDGNREIDLSWWILKVGDKQFNIPEHTVILSGSSLIFSSEVTGIHPENKSDVILKYPNGMLVDYAPDVEEESTQLVTNTDNKSIVGMKVESQSVGRSVVLTKETLKEDSGDDKTVLIASVAEAYDNGATKDSPLYKWLFTLIVIIVVASSSVLFLRAQARKEITIID